MTTDYPDWSRLIQVIGSDIMIPIDVQGAYIMMPIDIQGQYVTLDIDIVAQTVGNINVDLAAQTVGNISIDVAAQTMGDLNINIDAQTVGVYLQPDWNVLQGTDKDFAGVGNVAPGTTLTVIDYTVPTGKTFYICQWGFTVQQDVGINGILQYRHNDTYPNLAVSGGRVGNSHSFTKPNAVVAGDHVILKLVHFFTDTTTVFGTIGGYEL